MNRGEIWLAVWPTDPERKLRPVLLVSNDIRNQEPRLQDVVVLKLTSLENSSGRRKVTNPAEDVLINLKKPTIIRCSSIFTIEKSSIQGKLGQLSAADLHKVDICLKTVLDLN